MARVIQSHYSHHDPEMGLRHGHPPASLASKAAATSMNTFFGGSSSRGSSNFSSLTKIIPNLYLDRIISSFESSSCIISSVIQIYSDDLSLISWDLDGQNPQLYGGNKASSGRTALNLQLQLSWDLRAAYKSYTQMIHGIFTYIETPQMTQFW